jgi:hypothetical protein
MGMLVTMAILLACASVYVELKLVKSVPGLKKLTEKYGLVGLAMSLALSAALGAVFGAAGLVVMIAGLVSTAVTNPIYRLREALHSKNAHVQAKVATAKQAVADAKQTYRPVGKALKWTAIAATSPVWAPVVINKKMQARKEAVPAS